MLGAKLLGRLYVLFTIMVSPIYVTPLSFLIVYPLDDFVVVISLFSLTISLNSFDVSFPEESFALYVRVYSPGTSILYFPSRDGVISSLLLSDTSIWVNKSGTLVKANTSISFTLFILGGVVSFTINVTCLSSLS